MPQDLTVAGTVYEYPVANDNPGWGEDATAWAAAVTTVLANFQGTNDILETTVSIADHRTSFTNLLGFLFDPALVRSFEATYNVFRTDGANPIAETGKFHAVYNETSWDFSQEFTGDAGMDFRITAAGQMQYKSSPVGGTYSGTMKFEAKTLDK